MNEAMLTEDVLRTHPLPMPTAAGSKQHRGQVLIVGGSRQVPGAALLAGVSALRSGAGILQIATVESAAVALAVAIPESMVLGVNENDDGSIDPARCEALIEVGAQADAILIGPGMTGTCAVRDLTLRLLQSVERAKFVLDARACSSAGHFAGVLREHQERIVLTPHAGEMAAFLNIDRAKVESDMLGAGRRAAQQTGATIAMKGAETYVIDPRGHSWLFQGGSIALATSGSGDTLAGIIAGLLARGADVTQATLWGVYMHAKAGERLSAKHGPLGALAREIPNEIPSLMCQLSARDDL